MKLLTKRKTRYLFCFALFNIYLSAVAAKEPVTIESLLSEMIDRDAMARFPESDFRLKQHSSYNRASKTPDEPEGWFTNKDFNSKATDKNFIRIEENAGKQEWVLMDHKGPGAIVRTWMPWRSQNNPATTNRIRIYLDGAAEPVLEGNMLGLLDGTGLIPYPLAHSSLRSAVSFFPIPYAKSCKVTTAEQPFFFQFTFREYAEGTPVKTFTMADFKEAATLTERVGKTLLNPQRSAAGKPLTLVATLAPKEEKTMALPAGTAAVRSLSVKLGSYEDTAVTRSVVLKMEFDGTETVWCPVGDFFGTGIGLHPFQGWYRTVAADGTMSCRWIMPYQKSGKISIVNLGNKPVDVQLEAQTGHWKWDDRSMYFNAAWRGQYPVPTRPFSDWNYVTLKGRGVYVGDTLTVMNPVENWWGEGDEKIWVDGDDFPSIFGTGTEDYYAYSWGGRSTDFYEHPFHAQVRCNKYDKLNRKTIDERNTQGYSTETRTRSLDTMPFASSLQLDMEVWSGTDCDMGYGVGMYWYADAATTSNRKPEPQEVLNVPPLPEVNADTPKQAPPSATTGSFKNSVEAESMKVVSKTGDIVLMPQTLNRYKGNWSAGSHLLFKEAKIGDVVELRFPAQGTVAKKLVLYATKSYDFGIIEFTIKGKVAGAKVDLYAAAPTPSGPIELGVFAPSDGAYILRAEVVGRNPNSKGTLFGLDCVSLSTAEQKD